MSTFRFSIEEVKRLVKANNEGDGFKLDAVHDNGVYLMAKDRGKLSGGIIIYAFSCSDFQNGVVDRFDISNDFCNEILKQKGDVKVTVNIRSSNISFYKKAKKYNRPKPFRIEF